MFFSRMQSLGKNIGVQTKEKRLPNTWFPYTKIMPTQKLQNQLFLCQNGPTTEYIKYCQLLKWHSYDGYILQKNAGGKSAL